MKKIVILILIVLGTLVLVGCNDANVASRNLSQAADNFEIDRRVVFYNGITWEYLLEIQGRCSIWNNDKAWQVSITCKVWHEQYKKHYLWLSDNVTYFAEQLESKNVSVYHYRVTFKPQAIIPDIDFRWSTTDLPREQN